MVSTIFIQNELGGSKQQDKNTYRFTILPLLKYNLYQSNFVHTDFFLLKFDHVKDCSNTYQNIADITKLLS